MSRRHFREVLILLSMAAIVGGSGGVAAGCAMMLSPTPIPTSAPTLTATPTPIATPAPTPTPVLSEAEGPRHVALPPAEDLAYMIAAEAGSGFRYLPWHYVAEDSVVWLVFGWPEQDDRLYKAVFGMVGGEWVLLGVEPVGEETREAWR